MIGDEPYRWLEAVQNRREYIEDQIKPAEPIAVVSGAPGLLLATIDVGTPKLFEVYDHLALGCLGHPADIETVRQAAIDTAHLEGFTRSPQDVGSRRLVAYSLAPALKKAFEQIFAAPLIFQGVLAELGAEPADDQAWTIHYDGDHKVLRGDRLRAGFVVGARHTEGPLPEAVEPGWPALVRRALQWLAWCRDARRDGAAPEWTAFPGDAAELLSALGSDCEFAVLDRTLWPKIAFRRPTRHELGL